MSQVKKLQSGGTVDATNTVDLGNYYKVTRTKNGDYLLNNDPTKQIIFNEKQEATIGGIVDPYLSKIQLKSDDNGNLLKGNQSIKFHTGNWVKIDGIDVPVTDELKSKIRESTNPTNYKSAEELNLVLDELGNGIKEINKNQLIVDPNSNYYRKSNVTRYSGKQYRQTKREAKESDGINEDEAKYLGDKTNFSVQRTNPLFGNRVAANLLNDITNSSSAVKEELTPKGVTTSLDTLASQVNKDFFTKGKGFYNEELWDVNKETGERTWNKDKGTDLGTNYFNNLQQIVTNPTLDTSKYTALLPQDKNFSDYVGGLKDEFTKNGFTPELGSQMDLLRQMGLYNYDKNKFKQYIKESSAVEQPNPEKEKEEQQSDIDKANEEFKKQYNNNFKVKISRNSNQVLKDDNGFFYTKDDEETPIYFYKLDYTDDMIPSNISPNNTKTGKYTENLPDLDTSFEFFNSDIPALQNLILTVSDSGTKLEKQKGKLLFDPGSNAKILGFTFPSKYSGITRLEELLNSNTEMVKDLDNLKDDSDTFVNNKVFKLHSYKDRNPPIIFRIENGRVNSYQRNDDGSLTVAPVNIYKNNDGVTEVRYVKRNNDIWRKIDGVKRDGGTLSYQSGGKAPKLDFTPSVIATKENMTEKGYFSDKRYKYSDEKTGGFDKPFTTNDYVALGSLVADLGSAISGLVPGVGNIVSGGLGLAGSLGQIYLNANDEDGYDWGKELASDAANIGLDLVSFIPVLGMSAKAIKIGKIGKNIHKSSGLIKKVLSAVPASLIVASGISNGQELWNNLDDPNHEFGTEELLSIGRLLIAATNTTKLIKNSRIIGDKSPKYAQEKFLEGKSISKLEEKEVIKDLTDYSKLKTKQSNGNLGESDSQQIKSLEDKFSKNYGQEVSGKILENIDKTIIKSGDALTKSQAKDLDKELFTTENQFNPFKKTTYKANQSIFNPSTVQTGIVKTVDLGKIKSNSEENTLNIPTKKGLLESGVNNTVKFNVDDGFNDALNIIKKRSNTKEKTTINDLNALFRQNNLDFDIKHSNMTSTFKSGGSLFPIDKRQSLITDLRDNYTTQPFVHNDSIKQTGNNVIKSSNTINNPIGITKYQAGGSYKSPISILYKPKVDYYHKNSNNEFSDIGGFFPTKLIDTKMTNGNNITNTPIVTNNTEVDNQSTNNNPFINIFKSRDPNSVIAKQSPLRSLGLESWNSSILNINKVLSNKYNLLNDPTFNLPKLNSSSSSVIVPNTNPIVPTTTSISTPKYNNFDILSAVKGAVPEVVNLTTNWANRNIAKRQAEDVKRTIQGLQPAKVNYIEQGLQNYINKDLFGDQNAIKNLRNSMLITNTANSNQNRAYALAAEDKIGQYNTTVNNEFRKNILNTDAANQQIKDRNMQNRVAAFNTNMEKAIDFDMNKKLTTAGIDKQIVGDTSKMNILSGITLGNIINKGVNSITNDKYEQALEQYTNKYNNIIRTLKAKDSSMSDEELKTAATEQLKSTPVALELERLKRKYNTDNSSLSVSNYSKGGSLTLEEREYLIKLRKNLKITEENNKYLKKLLKIK